MGMCQILFGSKVYLGISDDLQRWSSKMTRIRKIPGYGLYCTDEYMKNRGMSELLLVNDVVRTEYEFDRWY